jgi:hypothetical protein
MQGPYGVSTQTEDLRGLVDALGIVRATRRAEMRFPRNPRLDFDEACLDPFGQESTPGPLTCNRNICVIFFL